MMPKKELLAKTLYEDSDILVVDKPAGLVVNRSESVKEETLQDQLAKYFNLKTGDFGIGGRAGIVHRLDRETSGVLLIAKTVEAFDFLQKQFKEREVKKVYVVLVHGLVKEKDGVIEGKLGRIGKFGKFGVNPVSGVSRESRTDFQVGGHYQFDRNRFDVLIHQNKLARSRINYLNRHAKDYSLLHLFPQTGRTHQVRVHLKSIGHAIVSDPLYDPAKLLKFDRLFCPRLFLHATRLSFLHPVTRKRVEFSSRLPNDLKGAILYLEEI